ncbi:tyrosine-type recombinase/integrase [Bifidobacterium magnum]|nr:site-specific integrase [Bifidobacterium magnum]
MRNAILDLDVRVSSALLPDKTYGLYDESKRLILIDRRRFDINKSATEVCRRIVVGTPKTHELRTVMFPAVLGPLLPVRGKGDDDLLFADPTSPTGYIMQVDSPKTGSSWFTRACDAAGVPRMTVHDLRHTAASLMVRSGANVKAVQRQLGHASAAMTLDVYADLFDDDLDSVSESLDRLLKSSGD